MKDNQKQLVAELVTTVGELKKKRDEAQAAYSDFAMELANPIDLAVTAAIAVVKFLAESASTAAMALRCATLSLKERGAIPVVEIITAFPKDKEPKGRPATEDESRAIRNAVENDSSLS